MTTKSHADSRPAPEAKIIVRHKGRDEGTRSLAPVGLTDTCDERAAICSRKITGPAPHPTRGGLLASEY